MIDPSDIRKSPRLFVNQALGAQQTIALEAAQTHYLKNVLRRPDASLLRVFNGVDGEWGAVLRHDGKRDAVIFCEKLLRPQQYRTPRIHLLFAPIKKDRMDFLIEKSVELGVTDLQPVLTAQTMVRAVNEDRLAAQIVEAAEQCERVDLPRLHQPGFLPDVMRAWDAAIPLYAALERVEAPPLHALPGVDCCGLLIGPEGGFTPSEIVEIKRQRFVQPVSLGPDILRAETAALAGIVQITAARP